MVLTLGDDDRAGMIHLARAPLRSSGDCCALACRPPRTEDQTDACDDVRECVRVRARAPLSPPRLLFLMWSVGDSVDNDDFEFANCRKGGDVGAAVDAGRAASEGERGRGGVASLGVAGVGRKEGGRRKVRERERETPLAVGELFLRLPSSLTPSPSCSSLAHFFHEE